MHHLQHIHAPRPKLPFMLSIVFAILIFALLPQGAARAVPPGACGSETTIYSADFTVSDQGWTSTLVSGSSAPWFRLPSGWAQMDDILSSQNRLTSPTITIPAGATEIFLSFSHSYVLSQSNLHSDPADGGQVQANVNGSGFSTIAGSLFSQNGYDRRMLYSGSPIYLQYAFGDLLAGATSTVVDLSSVVTGGQTIQLGFLFSADDHDLSSSRWRIVNARVGYCRNPPSLTSANNTSFIEGSAGSFTVTASGTSPITYGLSGAPGWLSINASSGVLSGTPPAGSFGSHTFSITASNGVNPNATQTFTLTVTGVAPSITSAASVSVVSGSAFSHTFTASGNPAPTLSYVPGTLPAGVTLVGNTLSGTPTAPGTYTINVAASNGINPNAAQTFTLTVTAPPSITSPAAVSAAYGTYFSHTFTASGNPAPTLSYAPGMLPAGVTLVGNVLSGTPMTLATFTINVTASNGVNPNATQTFILTVTGSAPTITSAASVSVVSGSAFSHTFTASGNPAPTLSYAPGTLPAGVTLVGNTLSGTPTAPGTYTIDVTASNGVNPNAAQTFTLTVTAPPSITSAASASVLATTSFSHTFAASGNPAPALSYAPGTLPAGVTLAGDVLSGTPTVPGTYTVDVTASNGVSPNATQTFTLTVTGSAPAITSAASASVLATASFSHTFAASGNPAPALSYAPGTLPAGVTLAGDVLSGTPTVPGTYTIDVTAANGISPNATQTFTLTVTGDAPAITSAGTLYVEQGNSLAHHFAAVGNPAPALSYSAVNLPPGVTLTGNSLAGYPQLSGTYGVTVTASNGVNPAAVQYFVLNVGALPEAPPLPFAEDVNFLESTAVRTGVPMPLFDTILVRTMYQYGRSTQWLGSDMYSAGSIGIQGVIDLGVQQAIDLSSGNGDTYWEGGATFCLHGEGPLIWMAAANIPRHAEIIGSYTVPEFVGYTCATLFEPGTLVLVRQLPE